MDEKKLALLVKRAIKGDINAFEEVYAEHAQAILFHVRNQIVDKERYQDVAQEVTLLLWRNIAQLRRPAAFRSWMHQIIRTACASHNRSLLKERESLSTGDAEKTIELLPIETTGEEGDPALLTVDTDDKRRLFAAITTLSPAYREAITLRYYDGLSYKEIADALDISVSAVGTNIKRGTEHLQKMLLGEAPEGAAMNENTKSRQTGAAVVGTFAATEENIRLSLIAGVNERFPRETVETFIKETGLILKSGEVASVAAVAGATAKRGGGNGAIALITVATAVFALTSGAYGLGATVYSDIQDTQVQEQEIIVEKQQPSTALQYSGNPRIQFISADGESSPYGVVAIALEDTQGAPLTISWTVYTSGGTQVLSGEGVALGAEAGLDELPLGEYKVNFTLINEQGASALCSRTFTRE